MPTGGRDPVTGYYRKPGWKGTAPMHAAPQHDPKYRHYKPKDLAVVRMNGCDH
jgi:hypothetical protein